MCLKARKLVSLERKEKVRCGGYCMPMCLFFVEH